MAVRIYIKQPPVRASAEVRRAFVEKLDELTREYHEIDGIKDRAALQIEEGTARQSALQVQANSLFASASAFGFDLSAEHATSRLLMESDAELMPPSEDETVSPWDAPRDLNGGPTSIRETVLEWARMSYPAPVRAATLRRRLKDVCNLEVHEKTVGMTLYRLSQRGLMRRTGFDWFFVPESERSAKASQEALNGP